MYFTQWWQKFTYVQFHSIFNLLHLIDFLALSTITYPLPESFLSSSFLSDLDFPSDFSFFSDFFSLLLEDSFTVNKYI